MFSKSLFRRLAFTVKCALLLLVLFDGPAFSQLPVSFQKVELMTGLRNAVNFEFAPDGRIFIVDRYGALLIYKPQTQTTVSAGTLNVFHDMEDGLLGLAFDPSFSTNNFVYIHYSDPVLPRNRVSRFRMNGDVIDLASEVVVIEWTSDRNGYFHAAGDMDFDSHGNLYIAIGDNTNHTPYAPLNESDPGQSAERTSSNTHDLRGKILRITPQPDGTYTIPEGNLFPNGTGGRAEIYVMGTRNPYKIFVDKTNTDWLFWGEVGPDANVESEKGPEGMDEINLVKNAGNFGWPYLSGKNEPYLNSYADPDFYYDHAAPVNLSRWNTGVVNLPAAQPSWLEFFHGCHLAGPRYYYDPSIDNPRKLPSDFHQSFFYYDFNTSKIWVVELDANGNVLSNQRFAEGIITGAGFIDMKIGPDGQLYILEYGSGCCPNNVGSGKLVRVDYNGIDSNKAPQVSMEANLVSGPVPLTINFSSEGTLDPDGDALTFEWDFQSDGTIDSYEAHPTFTYTQAGTFNALLRVRDSRGSVSAKTLTIYPGNSAAEIIFAYPPDGGMISWEDMLQYRVAVNDPEDGSTTDGSILCSDVNLVPAFGHLSHSHDALVINQCAGTFYLDPTSHDAQGQDDIYYVFKVNYTDAGGLTVFDEISVHPKLMEAEFFDTQNNTKLVDNTDVLGGGVYSVRALTDNSYVTLDKRNLQNISAVSYRISSSVGGVIEVHADSPGGQLLSTVRVAVTGAADRWTHVTTPIIDPGGRHDLYFVFKNPGAINLFDLNYIEFLGPGVSTDQTPPGIYDVEVLSKGQIRVRFNEPLGMASATDPSNFSITGNVDVASTSLEDDRRTVIIHTSPMVVGAAYELTISNIQNESGVAMTTSIVSPIELDEVMTRINAGGPLVDVNGIRWDANQYNTGGLAGSKPSLSINNTTADVIYQTELLGNFSYNIPIVDKGVYDVKLHFAELVYTGSGQRIFNVDIEGGQRSLLNYDIYSKAGYATAIIESLDSIVVDDGFLSIVFTNVKNNSKVSAIEVYYGDESGLRPAVEIINPGEDLTLIQPFDVHFQVSNWWVANGSSHIETFVDGVHIGNIYDHDPITFDGLTIGPHTIRLVLATSESVLTNIQDEVQVNVADGSACLQNPFPLLWDEYVIGSDLPYRSPHIFAADIDGDGYKDIVTGGWWYKNPRSPKSLWTRNTIGLPMNNMFVVYDLDKDGDTDILGTVGTYLGSKMAWARNDGAGNFVIYTNIPEAAGFPPGSTLDNNTFLSGSAVGNFNNVANIQIALVWNGSETTKAPVRMLTVPQDPVNQTWLVSDIAPNAVGEAIHAIDIDQDGDLDLSQIKNWLRNDNGSWTTITTGLTMPSYYEQHMFADLDRDSALDGVMTQIGDNAEVYWFKVPADPTQSWTRSTLATDVDSGLSLDIADLDFDGDADVIVGEWKEQKRLLAFENDLCNSGTWIRHILHPGGTSAPDHHDGTHTADLDNDGDLDIISIGWDKRTPRIYINNSSSSSNMPPVVSNPIADQSTLAGSTFSFTIPSSAFTDGNGDWLTYSATISDGSPLPGWLTFEGGARTFTGNPAITDVGVYDIRVFASDRVSSVSDDFTVSILDPSVNQPPVVSNPIPDVRITAGAPFNFSFPVDVFTDPNGDALAYSATLAGATALPTWLTFDGNTRTFQGMPGESDIGSVEIVVIASDESENVSDVFSLTVEQGGSIRINCGSGPINVSGAEFGGDYYFNGGASYANNDIADILGTTEDALYKTERSRVFDYQIPVPAGEYLIRLHFAEIYFGATGGGVGGIGKRVFNVTGEGQPLLTNFDIFAEVGAMTALVREFAVTVSDGVLNLNFIKVVENPKVSGIEVLPGQVSANAAPIVATFVPDQEAVVGSLYSYSFPQNTFTDADGDVLSYSALLRDGTALPSWLSFESSTRAFSGTPVEGGAYDIRVTATDGLAAVSDVFRLTIPDLSVNQPPVVNAPIPDQSVAANTFFSYSFPVDAFVDPEGMPLVYTVALGDGSPLPLWMTFDDATRSFSGTPGDGDAGQISVVVTASDGNESASQAFSVTVATQSEFAVRINAGGPMLNAYGVSFDSDQYYLGGKSYTNSNIMDIAATDADQLYRTERSGIFVYNIPVPAGTFLVRLHFAEIYFGATGGGAGDIGKRVFNVLAEGTPLLTNFDIIAAAGGSMTAVIRDFQVSVNDGMLNLNFTQVTQNPKVSAVEVVALGLSPNQPPYVSNPIPDQRATQGVRFDFAFASNTFSDPDSDALTFSASLANGDPLPAWLSFLPSSGTFNGIPDVQDVGTTIIEVKASDASGSFVTDRFDLVVASSSTAPEGTRINAGGSAYTSISSAAYSADFGFTGGAVYSNPNVGEIDGTTDDFVYRSERYKMSSYDIAVASGTYAVALHFAEIYFGATGGGPGGVGKRVFNVSGEGVPLLTNFDIYAEAGAMKALVKRFDVTVTDGVLNLIFERVIENPKISAIEIVPVNTVDAMAAARTKSPEVITSSIGIPDEEAPVFSAYPNPFHDRVMLTFRSSKDQRMSLEIADMQGVLVARVFNGYVERGGIYQFGFDGSGLGSGFYIARVITKGKVRIFKLVLNPRP